MSTHIPSETIDTTKLREVWSVEEFCKRHRLCDEENARLRTLFGAFATKQELLANAQRPPLFR